MAVGDIYELGLVQQLGDKKAVNVFHYRHSVDSGGIDPAGQLNSGFDTSFGAAWAPVVGTDLKFLCLQTRRIDPTPGIPAILSPLSTTAGTDLGAPCANQKVIRLRKYPTNAGVPFLVGGTNITGTVQTVWQEGQLTSAHKSLVDTLAAFLVAAIVNGPDTWVPVIWSPTRKTGSLPPFFVDWDNWFVNFGNKVLRRRRQDWHDYA